MSPIKIRLVFATRYAGFEIYKPKSTASEKKKKPNIYRYISRQAANQGTRLSNPAYVTEYYLKVKKGNISERRLESQI